MQRRQSHRRNRLSNGTLEFDDNNANNNNNPLNLPGRAFVSSDSKSRGGIQLNLPFQITDQNNHINNNFDYNNLSSYSNSSKGLLDHLRLSIDSQDSNNNDNNNDNSNSNSNNLNSLILSDRDANTPARSSSASSSLGLGLGPLLDNNNINISNNNITTTTTLDSITNSIISVPLSARSSRTDHEFDNNNNNNNSSSSSSSDINVLHKEIARLQTLLAHSNTNNLMNNAMNMSKNVSSGRTIVSGSQFKSPHPAFKHCEFCANMDSRVKKTKESQRLLKLQNARLEDKISELQEIENDYKKLQNKLLGGGDSLQIELDKYKILVAEKIAENGSISRKLKNEVDSHNKTTALLRKKDEECHNLQSNLRSNEEIIERLRGELIVINTALEEKKKAMDVQRLRYESLLREARQEMTNKTKQKEIELTLREELESSRAAIDDLQAKLAMLISEHSREKESMKSHIVRAEAKLSEVNSHNTLLETKLNENHTIINDLKYEISELQNKNHDQLEQLKRKNNDLELENKELKDALASQKSNSQQRIAELMEMMTKDSESSSKALERAIGQSIRLCVVAPMVNLNVNDKRLQVNSIVDDTELNNVIQESVIKPFSKIFEQKESENESPEGAGGGDLNEWVSSMLKRMTTSLETHVHNAIKQNPHNK